MDISSWFLPLSESQIPAGESQLFGWIETSVAAEEFLESGIESTLNVIGCSWNGWIVHEAEKVRDGIAEQGTCSSKNTVGVPPTTRRSRCPFFQKSFVLAVPIPE